MSDKVPFGFTIAVDKPLTWTSFDVVNKLRYHAKRLTGQKKFKVGHAGTLDPLATGIVIVCFGRHTKEIERYMGIDKVYEGTFRLGATTPSFDLETPVDAEYPLPEQNPELLTETARSFVGTSLQVPPIYSAKKIDGQKAYIAARKGKEIEMKPNSIRITRFEIEAERFPDIDFVLECSKGTYVRSLAHDFGKALGGGAHLTRLVRTRIEPFDLSSSYTIEQAIEQLEAAYAAYLIAE